MHLRTWLCCILGLVVVGCGGMNPGSSPQVSDGGTLLPQRPPIPTQFEVRVLGPVEEVDALIPVAINVVGHVVGNYRPNRRGAGLRAFIQADNGATQRLPIGADTPIDVDEYVTAINDRGDIAAGIGPVSAIIASGSVTLLDLPPGFRYTQLTAINGAGRAVGWASDDTGRIVAVAWDGTFRELGQGSYLSCQALSLNESGIVVGVASGPKPVLFGPTGPQLLASSASTEFGAALAVNRTGRIVGRTGPVQGFHAFVYDLPSGPLRDVSPTAEYCELDSVNSDGVAVGSCDGAAVMWSEAGLVKLDTLVDAAGWRLQGATAINDRYEMVGTGLYLGHAAAFMLVPRAASPR